MGDEPLYLVPCIYCGLPATSRDHVKPRPWTGDVARRYVKVVPACMQCNAILGDVHEFSVFRRRNIVHTRLRKKHAKLLSSAEWSEEQLAELGEFLRGQVIARQAERRVLLKRLAWPRSGEPFWSLQDSWHNSAKVDVDDSDTSLSNA